MTFLIEYILKCNQVGLKKKIMPNHAKSCQNHAKPVINIYLKKYLNILNGYM
jgi:hypothetical protein